MGLDIRISPLTWAAIGVREVRTRALRWKDERLPPHSVEGKENLEAVMQHSHVGLFCVFLGLEEIVPGCRY